MGGEYYYTSDYYYDYNETYEPNYGNSSNLDSHESTTDHIVDWAKVVFSIMICFIGLIGNFLTLFVIVVLKEYKKSVTHWYVLQLAIADTIFLLTLPFKSSEDIQNSWLFPNWMCKAKESILFINYYASVLFLMIMSIDRYIAVCHSFSEKLQKFRRQWAASCITVVTWVVAIVLCTPIAMYSTKTGIQPNCKCQYEFEIAPKNSNWTDKCPDVVNILKGMFKGNDAVLMSSCLELATEFNNRFHENSFCRNEKEDGELVDRLFAIGKDLDTKGNTNVTTNISYSSTAFPGIEYTGTTIMNDQNYDVTGEKVLFEVCDYSGANAAWKIIIYFNFFIMFLFPISVMVLSYGLIIKKLRKTQVKSANNLRKNTDKSQKKKSTKSDKDRKRVTMMCATLVISFFLCWVLFHSQHLAKLIGIRVKYGNTRYCETLGLIGTLLGYLNSALNPYLYSFLGTNFSRRWLELRKIKWREPNFNFGKGDFTTLKAKTCNKSFLTNKTNKTALKHSREPFQTTNLKHDNLKLDLVTQGTKLVHPSGLSLNETSRVCYYQEKGEKTEVSMKPL